MLFNIHASIDSLKKNGIKRRGWGEKRYREMYTKWMQRKKVALVKLKSKSKS